MAKEIDEMTTEELFLAFIVAGSQGNFGRALSIADEICREERKGDLKDLLPDPRSFYAFQKVSLPQLEPMIDRVEQYNSFRR